MILMIDNYDSFTYNIYQELSQLTNEEIRVIRNNKITIEEIEKLNPSRIIISPGPGNPDGAGISLEVIRTFSGRLPILGVCLGHQAIAQCFGGKIIQAGEIVHGMVDEVHLDGKGLFRNLPQKAEFTRYHSLAAERVSLPDCLEITAETADGEIMGLRHKDYIVEGVQFHPESIGCLDAGRVVLKNFLRYKRDPLDKKGLIEKLQNGTAMSFDEAAEFMDELTEGALNQIFISAVLTALNCKGITAEEIAGCASVLKKKKVKIDAGSNTLDTCGTGGDGKNSFNISSFAALIAAACGVRVAKHGNKAVSSKSGSADFYSELGINYNLSPAQSTRLLSEEHFAFLFAPLFHSAMRFAGPVRAELGVKTLMNLLGPLVNPAEAEYQLIGVYSDELCPIMARAAKMIGVKRVMTIHSEDGLDEISPAEKTRIFTINEDGTEEDYIFDPKDAGFGLFNAEQLIGGTGEENAATARLLLDGRGPAAIRAACLLNAGAALAVSGISESIIDGCKLAEKALDSGKVKARLNSVIRKSNAIAAEGESS